MKQVKRFDLGRITSVEKTSQGYLKVPGYATRVGVFIYKRSDGKVIREYRPADEVFKEESLKTLANSPVTNDHPPELLTPQNTKQYQVGYTTDSVGKDSGMFVTITSIVADAKAIADVENGKRELSCGYVCDLEETPGTFKGEPYDVIQRNIVYNHLAIVKRGRAGPDVRLRLDAQDAEQVEPETDNQEKPMNEKITLDGKEFEVSPELAAAFRADSADKEKKAAEVVENQIKEDAAKKKAAAMPAESKKEEEEEESEENEDSDKKEMQEKCDSLQAKVDHLTAELKSRQDALEGEAFLVRVRERVRLEKIAISALPKETKFDSMSDVELKKSVILTQDKNAQLEGKSDAYIDGRFDSIATGLEKSLKTNEKLSATILTVRQDAQLSDPEAARRKAMEESKNAYKNALSATKAVKALT